MRGGFALGLAGLQSWASGILHCSRKRGSVDGGEGDRLTTVIQAADDKA